MQNNLIKTLYSRFTGQHYVVINYDSEILPLRTAEIRVYFDARPSIPHYVLVYKGTKHKVSLLHFPNIYLLHKKTASAQKKLQAEKDVSEIEPQVTTFLRSNMPRIRARYNHFEYCCHVWNMINPRHKI